METTSIKPTTTAAQRAELRLLRRELELATYKLSLRPTDFAYARYSRAVAALDAWFKQPEALNDPFWEE